MTVDEKPERPEFSQVLTALDLTWDDVRAGREGEYTPAHLAQLDKALLVSGGCMTAFGIGVLLFGLMVVASVMLPGRNARLDAIFVVGVVPSLLFFVLSFYRQRLIYRDIRERQMMALVAPLELRRHQERNSDRVHYSMKLGSMWRYHLTAEAYMLLKMYQGEAFIAYFSRYSRVLLAFEPAEKSKPITGETVVINGGKPVWMKS